MNAPTELRRELGLADLVLMQVVFVVGSGWVGTAAKLGPSQLVFWLVAIATYYLPQAAVVIALNRRMPLEGGLYQWAKTAFGEFGGFLVAWNLWLFAILNTSEIGLQITQYFHYVLGARGAALATDRLFVTFVNLVILTALVLVTIRGLSMGKWVHKAGGAVMLATFGLLIVLPWLSVRNGTIASFHPLATALPVVSLLSLNIAAKMGFGALGGFEYVAIHAGECRNPERTIARSVALAAPIICVMFVLGTSSVLALVPMDEIDLIAPIPQVLAAGFGKLGYGASIAPIAILAVLFMRVAQSSVMFAGNTRLPMVAGWDGLLPRWFTQLHPTYQTPVNSILFVGAVTLAFSVAGLIGVGKQEAFQLLWNASAIFYALTYLVMFAVPIAGARPLRGPWWLTLAAISGFLMTLAFVVLSILPIVQVASWWSFALKISTVIVATNAIGIAIFLRARTRTRRRL